MFYPASHPEIKKHIVQIDEIIVRRTETELTCLRLLSDIGDGILKTIQKGKLLLNINMASVSNYGLLEEYNRSKHLQYWKFYYPKYQVSVLQEKRIRTRIILLEFYETSGLSGGPAKIRNGKDG